MSGQPNQVRPVTLSVNMKHRFFLLKICCVDSHLYYLWKAWHRWYVASKMAGIPYFSRSPHKLTFLTVVDKPRSRVLFSGSRL